MSRVLNYVEISTAGIFKKVVAIISSVFHETIYSYCVSFAYKGSKEEKILKINLLMELWSTVDKILKHIRSYK